MSEGEKETWNMANATLKRFDFLLRQCSLFSQTGRLLAWKNCLMDLRRNLFPFMTESEFEEVNDKFNSLPPGWINRGGGIHPNLFSEVNRIFDEIYIIFISVMKKKGLLMPKTLDTSKSIIDM